jgi:hypothetical protein
VDSSAGWLRYVELLRARRWSGYLPRENVLGDKQRHIDGEAHVGYLKEVGIKAVHVHQPHDTQNKHHNLPYVEGAKYEEKE